MKNKLQLNSTRTLSALLAGCWLLATPSVGSAAQHTLFSDPLDGSIKQGWRCAPTNFLGLADGTQVLRVQNGSEWNATNLPWVGNDRWTSYRVEVEIQPEKMWAEIDFHVQDDGRAANAVTLFRTTKGELFFETGALWGEAGAWKLWPIGQRQAHSQTGEWVRVRLDVGASVANLFINDDPKPVATFYDLPFTKGGIRLATYAGSALFRNLRVIALPKDEVKPILEDIWAEARRGHVFRAWEATPRQEKGYGEDQLPEGIARGSVRWLKAPVDARGVVNLTGLFAPNNTNGVTFARTMLNSPEAGIRKLKLTYTDNFTLWCNGRRVFKGPPRQWFHPDRQKYGNSRLIPDQFETEVPVHAGDNTLLVRSEITEPFGWAFWIRVVDP